MSNDMRMIKYKTLIENIDEELDGDLELHPINTDLLLIYDYDKLNEYGKLIVDNSHLSYLSYEEEFDCSKEELIEMYKDPERKIATAQNAGSWFVRHNTEQKYIFLFWALMVLTVDKTDKEEKLSLICDFAKMMDAKDEVIMDIIQVIRIIYGETELRDAEIDLIKEAYPGAADKYMQVITSFKTIEVVYKFKEVIAMYNK